MCPQILMFLVGLYFFSQSQHFPEWKLEPPGSHEAFLVWSDNGLAGLI
jgi:hypothetical protein